MQQYGSTPYCVLLYNILKYIAILQYLTRCYVTAGLYVALFSHTVSVESHKQAILNHRNAIFNSFFVNAAFKSSLGLAIYCNILQCAIY